MSTVKMNDHVGDRWYTRDDERYPSVNTCMSILINAGLLQWIKKSGSAGQQTSETAMSYGSDAHDILAGVKPMPLPNTDLYKTVMFGKDFLKRVDFKPLPDGVEKAVFSKIYKYAGTLDLLGTVLDPDFEDETRVLAIVDWKTGDLRNKALWQVAAYRQAWEEEQAEAGEVRFIQRGYIIGLPKEKTKMNGEKYWTKGSEIPMKPVGLDRAFSDFMAIKRLWELDKLTQSRKRMLEYLEGTLNGN